MKPLIARRTCGGQLAHLINHGFPYHCVLAHQDNTLASEGVSNLVHLLTRYIVYCDDED